MRLKISHETRYKYSGPVSYLLQQIRLTPKKCDGQKIIEWRTEVEGGVKEAEFHDQYNNLVMLFSIEPNLTETRIIARGEVETENQSGVVREPSSFVPLWLFNRETNLTKTGKGVRRLARSVSDLSDDQISQLHTLSANIREEVSYTIGSTDSATSAEDSIELGEGVCQDHAHIFISCARHLGFPARYVSGYLMMNDRVDQDASHAWAEAFIEGLGWTGFDVSNGISPDDRYVRLATGLDYRDAAPISGMRIGASAESLDVSIQVQQ